MTATTSQPKKTPLNPQAQILDAASEEIRRIVKDAFLMRDTRDRTNRLVWDVIRRAVGKLTVDQTARGETLYLVAAEQTSDFLPLTTESGDAVTVYREEGTNGGYQFYFILFVKRFRRIKHC